MKIVIDINNKIQAVFDGDENSVPRSNGDKILKVPDNFYIDRYNDIRAWDKDFNVRPSEELLTEGLLELKEDEKIEKGKVIRKSLQELFECGLFVPQDGYKCEGNSIVPLSDIEKLKKGKITIEDCKTNLCNYCKDKTQNIIYDVYPIYKQQNAFSDFTYISQFIALEMNKSVQEITFEVCGIIDKEIDIKGILSYLQNNIDFSNYITNYSPKYEKEYKKLLESIVGYKAIKIIRDWCNKKCDEINMCENAKELEEINIKDYPALKS